MEELLLMSTLLSSRSCDHSISGVEMHGRVQQYVPAVVCALLTKVVPRADDITKLD